VQRRFHRVGEAVDREVEAQPVWNNNRMSRRL